MATNAARSKEYQHGYRVALSLINDYLSGQFPEDDINEVKYFVAGQLQASLDDYIKELQGQNNEED